MRQRNPKGDYETWEGMNVSIINLMEGPYGPADQSKFGPPE